REGGLVSGVLTDGSGLAGLLFPAYGRAMVGGALTCVNSVIADTDFQRGAATQGAFDAGGAAGHSRGLPERRRSRGLTAALSERKVAPTPPETREQEGAPVPVPGGGWSRRGLPSGGAIRRRQDRGRRR